MIWIAIVLLLLFIAGLWLVLSPFELRIDTRVPLASFSWFSFGKAMVVYENEDWVLKVNVLFINKQWSLLNMILNPGKAKKKVKPKTIIKKPVNSLSFIKLIHILKSFRLTELKISIDSGNYSVNAWMYVINFLPYTKDHVHINFIDENYLVINIRNAPWRIIYAWLR